jgi:hypothetical protein
MESIKVASIRSFHHSHRHILVALCIILSRWQIDALYSDLVFHHRSSIDNSIVVGNLWNVSVYSNNLVIVSLWVSISPLDLLVVLKKH